MSRYLAVVGILVVAVINAQAADDSGRKPDLVALLEKPVNFGGIDDPKTTLEEALYYLSNQYGIHFTVNEDAFQAATDKDVLQTQIAEKPIPKISDVTLSTVLRRILTEVTEKHNIPTTWIVRRDEVEITTVDAKERDKKKREILDEWAALLDKREREMAALLEKPINFSGIADPKTTLEEALDSLKTQYNIHFTVNEEAFEAAERTTNKLNAYATIVLQTQLLAAASCSSYFLTTPAKVKKVLQTAIAEKPIPEMSNVTLSTVLRQILSEATKKHNVPTTWFVWRDEVAITTIEAQYKDKKEREDHDKWEREWTALMDKRGCKIAALLEKPITFGGIDDPKTTLEEALGFLQNQYGIQFTVNEGAFGVAGAKEVLQTAIAHKPIPKMSNVALATVLRRILSEVTKSKKLGEANQATWLIRRGEVEITTFTFKIRVIQGREFPSNWVRELSAFLDIREPEMAALLKGPIYFGGIDDPKTTLEEALAILKKWYRLQNRYNIHFRVNEDAFEVAGAKEVLQTAIAHKPIPKMSNVALATVLRRILSEVTKSKKLGEANQATWLIRRGEVEITTFTFKIREEQGREWTALLDKREREMAALLEKPINFGGIDDPKTTLKEALASLQNQYSIHLTVNEDAFQAANVKDVLQTAIAGKPIPRMRDVALSMVLRWILAEVTMKHNVLVAWIVRSNDVEITTFYAKDMEKRERELSAFLDIREREMAALLKRPINFGGINDPKTTLKEALAILQNQHGIHFTVNTDAFQAAKCEDVLQTVIADKPIPKMSNEALSTVLRRILAKVTWNRNVPTTWIIRHDEVEITTFDGKEKEKRECELADLLEKRIDFGGINNPQTTLDEALGFLHKLSDIRFTVDLDAFEAAGVKEVMQTNIAEQEIPKMKNVATSTVLRQILTAVTKKHNVSTTWIVRLYEVEITTEAAHDKEKKGKRR